MRKLLLLFVVSLASITLAEAQIIRSSRGVVKTNTVTVENEKPATHSNRWREIGAKTQTLALDINNLCVRYQTETRESDMFSWGWGGAIGVVTSVFGSIRLDMFSETLANSRFIPYFGLNGGASFDFEGEEFYLLSNPHIGFGIAGEKVVYGLAIGWKSFTPPLGHLTISFEIKF